MIGLGREGRNRDRPEPRAAADLPAALRRIDEGRPGHGRRPIEALDTLDERNLRESLLARPCIDGGRFEPRIDREFRQAQANAMGVRPGLAEEIRQSRPSFGTVRAAGDPAPPS